VHHKRLYFLRNRIIAGMARLVVVVEARPKGGTVHMIEWALKRGKPTAVFEHPDRGSVYYRGFWEFVREAGRLAGARLYVVKSVDELEGVVRRFV